MTTAATTPPNPLEPNFLPVMSVQAKDRFILVPRTVKLQDGTEYIFSDKGLNNLVSSFKSLGRPLALDYEHQTLGSTPGFDYFKSPDGTAPAAGWVGDVSVTPDGLEASGVKWTPRALKMIQDGEYRYFSPVLFWPKGGMWTKGPTGIGPAALTNDPEINGLQALAARSLHAQLLTHKESTMDLKKLLSELMGLDANAPDDQFATACKQWVSDAKQKMTASKTEREQEVTSLKATHETAVVALKSGHTGEVSTLKTAHDSAISALKSQHATEVSALKAKMGQIVVDALEQTGKIASASKANLLEKAKSDPDFVIETFKDVKVGAVVPVGSLNFQQAGNARLANDAVSASKSFQDAPADRQQLHVMAKKYEEQHKVSYADAVMAVSAGATVA